jgi:hypothetical protein
MNLNYLILSVLLLFLQISSCILIFIIISATDKYETYFLIVLTNLKQTRQNNSFQKLVKTH